MGTKVKHEMQGQAVGDDLGTISTRLVPILRYPEINMHLRVGVSRYILNCHGPPLPPNPRDKHCYALAPVKSVSDLLLNKRLIRDAFLKILQCLDNIKRHVSLE